MCFASTIEFRRRRRRHRQNVPARALPNNTLTTMKRTDPTFKENQLSDLEREELIDEMFAQLFDSAPIDSDTDKVPDFRVLGKLK